jgi:hypothetical protein
MVGIRDIPSGQREDQHISLTTTRYTRHEVTALRAGGPSGRTLSFLKLKSVAKFSEDLARVVVVEAAKRKAVVEQDAAVGYIGCGD